MKIFRIQGYYNDDGDNIDGMLITDHHDTPKGYNDDDIFFYGIKEEDLIGQHEDFTITSYEVVDED